MIWQEIKRVVHNRICTIIFVIFVLLSLATAYNSCFGSDVKDLKSEIDSSVFVSEEGRQLKQYHEQYRDALEKEITTLDDQISSFLFTDKKPLQRQRDNVSILIQDGNIVQSDLQAIKLMNVSKYYSIAWFILGASLIHCLLQEDNINQMQRLYVSCAKTTQMQSVSKMTCLIFFMTVAFVFKTAIDFRMIRISGTHLQVPIQTVRGYLQLNGTWQIWQYMLHLYFQQWLSVIFCLLVFILLSETTGSHGIASVSIIMTMVTEYLLYVFVSLSSPYAYIKKWNIYTWMTSITLDQEVGMPEKTLLYLFVTTFALWLACTAKYGHIARKKHRRLKASQGLYKQTWIYRLREVLITGKGAFIIILAILYCYGDMIRYESHSSTAAREHAYLAQNYYGVIDEQLLERIEQDRMDIQEASRLFAQSNITWSSLTNEEREQMRTLQRKAESLPVILEIESEVKELYAANARYYTDNTGIQLLFNTNGSLSGYSRSLLALLPVCILVVTTMSPLYTSGIWRMFAASKNGKKQMMKDYAFIFTALGILLYLIVFGFNAGKVILHFGIGETRQRVCDCLGLQSEMNLLPYTIIKIFLRIVTLRFLIYLSMLVSTKTGVVTGMALVSMVCLAIATMPGISLLLQYSYIDHPYIATLGMLTEITGISLMKIIIYNVYARPRFVYEKLRKLYM